MTAQRPRSAPAARTRPPSPPHTALVALLVALLVAVTAITAELVRMAGPLINAAATTGVLGPALIATGTYAAAGLFVLALCLRRPIDGRVVLLAVGALVLGRVGTQALDGTARSGVALATVALSVATLVVVAAAAARVSGRAVAAGAVGGLALSAALNLTLRTWDPVWRPGALGWAVTLALVVTAGALAWQLRTLPATPAVRGLWLLGPYLGLAVLTFANPAFIASQAGLPLWLAGVVVVLAAGGAAALIALPVPDPTRLPAWTDGVVVVAAAGAAVPVFFAPGWPQDPPPTVSVLVAAAVVLLAGSTTIALAQALTRPVHRQRSLRLTGAATCAGLGTILPLQVYQLDHHVALPFPNALLPVLAATGIAVLSVRARARVRARIVAGEVVLTTTPLSLRVQGPALVATCALVLVGITMTAPTGAPGTVDRAPGVFRLLSWNLNYGGSLAPAVELAQMAAVIRDSGADVVTLQEVSRGSLLGGGTDMAAYLSQNLGMEFVYVPAADRQLGNVIMWKPALGDLTDVTRTALPFGAGPQSSSAISGTLTDGAPVRITSVHLQHRAENTPTRLLQISVLLQAEPVTGHYLLAGDLNAEPGWPEPHMLAAAGLVSAQDAAGNPADLTHPSDVPVQRIDWVLGNDVLFTNAAVLDTQTSDHRPLVTIVTLDPLPTP